MERKTPRRAGGTPPYEPTPLGGCRWCGWVCFDYQANLQVHPCPVSWCAGRLPLRCCLRTAVVALGIFFRAAPCFVSMKKISAKAASKLARCVVSASAAASGLLTRLDDGCSCKSVWHSIQCAVAAPTPYAGGGFQRWGERPPPLVASFFPDSFFAIEERIGPPEGASPIAWKKLG